MWILRGKKKLIHTLTPHSTLTPSTHTLHSHAALTPHKQSCGEIPRLKNGPWVPSKKYKKKLQKQNKTQMLTGAPSPRVCSGGVMKFTIKIGGILYRAIMGAGCTCSAVIQHPASHAVG